MQLKAFLFILLVLWFGKGKKNLRHSLAQLRTVQYSFNLSPEEINQSQSSFLEQNKEDDLKLLDSMYKEDIGNKDIQKEQIKLNIQSQNNDIEKLDDEQQVSKTESSKETQEGVSQQESIKSKTQVQEPSQIQNDQSDDQVKFINPMGDENIQNEPAQTNYNNQITQEPQIIEQNSVITTKAQQIDSLKTDESEKQTKELTKIQDSKNKSNEDLNQERDLEINDIRPVQEKPQNSHQQDIVLKKRKFVGKRIAPIDETKQYESANEYAQHNEIVLPDWYPISQKTAVENDH